MYAVGFEDRRSHQRASNVRLKSRTQPMSPRIEARADEDVSEMVARFNQRVRHEYQRPWTKRRYGYYEKPSALRRKRTKMRKLQTRGAGRLYLSIDLETQFRRTGPTNAAGR